MKTNPEPRPIAITQTALKEVIHDMKLVGDAYACEDGAREIITTGLHRVRADEPHRHHWTYMASRVLLTAYIPPTDVDGRIVVQINQNHYHRLTK